MNQTNFDKAVPEDIRNQAKLAIYTAEKKWPRFSRAMIGYFYEKSLLLTMLKNNILFQRLIRHPLNKIHTFKNAHNPSLVFSLLSPLP